MNFENNKQAEKINKQYIMETSNLMKGDIIFSTSFEFISKSIKFFTNSDFSHVMLYVDNRSIIHADGKGVHAYNTQRILFDNEAHCSVYRLKNELSEEHLDLVINYMRRLIGRPYSAFEAILSKVYVGKWKSEKLFCSRLVSQAFMEAKIKFVPNPNYCSPEEIRKSSQLEKVKDFYLRGLTDVEKTIVLATEDKPLIQSKITNKVFNEINEYTSNNDIYDFETLLSFLIENPTYDEHISNIIRKSGYLIMWVNELKDNAPLYDSILYREIVSSEQKKDFEKTTTEMTKRFTNMYKIYKNYYLSHNLRTFRDFYSLYTILNYNSSLMLSTFGKIEEEEGSNEINTFIPMLVKIFFIHKALHKIVAESFYVQKYYELLGNTIEYVINNFDSINKSLVKYKLENQFKCILKNLIDINITFNDIVFIEVRQKRDPANFYDLLDEKLKVLDTSLGKVDYLNIIKY